jgi:phosphotransferase system HPr (HPr) family protein
MSIQDLTEERIISIKSDPRHASRSIEEMVRIARKFDSVITFTGQGYHEVSAKSLLSVLELCAEKPRQITAITQGPDANTAMEAIERFFDDPVLEMRGVPAGQPADSSPPASKASPGGSTMRVSRGGWLESTVG